MCVCVAANFDPAQPEVRIKVNEEVVVRQPRPFHWIALTKNNAAGFHRFFLLHVADTFLSLYTHI
jgi:hypothetical protein